MIELSLEKINIQSPYEVSYAPNGDFVFSTNLGIHYLISFESETPMGGCDVEGKGFYAAIIVEKKASMLLLSLRTEILCSKPLLQILRVLLLL